MRDRRDRERRGPGREIVRNDPARVPPRSQTTTIFGVLPVLEALRAERRQIERVLVAEGAREHRLQQIFETCRSRSIPCERVSPEALGRYLEGENNHQGVVALTAAAAYTDVDDILDKAASPALLLVLDGVEDPRNLGAILRSAEGNGVDGVILPERRAVGLTDTVAKASAGAIEYVRVGKTTNLNNFIEELKSRNIWVVGTSFDARIAHYEWDWRQPSALVLGGEGSGLHRLVAKNCDMLVKIPMYGKIDSLNVSVAAGVILSEARRQRSLGD